MLQRVELQRIMEDYTDVLFRIAYYYTKNQSTAEDIVQEVFIKLYYLDVDIKLETLRPFLAKMTANKSKDYLKSWAYRKMKLTEKLPFIANKYEFESNEESTALEVAVLALPLTCKEVITYYYYEGFSIKEIAQILNTNENTIKSRMKKAKQLLKNALIEEVEVKELEQLSNETV